MPNDQVLNIYCDGGARGNPGPAASAFIVKNGNQKILFQQGFYMGTATNNQAEYQAVFEAIKYLISNPYYAICDINFYLDSLLVVNQLNGVYKTKDQMLKIKNFEIKKIIENYKLKNISFLHIPRSQNSAADNLVNQTLDGTS
jgi:ribonuclease HI